jgi:hypothetical protein
MAEQLEMGFQPGELAAAYSAMPWDAQVSPVLGSETDPLWSWQTAPNAEFMDAAGGSLYQDYQDGFNML